MSTASLESERDVPASDLLGFRPLVLLDEQYFLRLVRDLAGTGTDKVVPFPRTTSGGRVDSRICARTAHRVSPSESLPGAREEMALDFSKDPMNATPWLAVIYIRSI